MDSAKEKPEHIKRAIVRTVAYFDMFDFPLTDFEIWKFMGEKCDYVDVRNILSSMSLRVPSQRDEAISVGGTDTGLLRRFAPCNDRALETKNGFYFLKGRENIIRTRMDRYNFTDRKFKRALRITKIYRLIPWVKMVAVANVIGAHNLKDGSDIDVFIISEKNKIWLTRFFYAGIAKILGLRPSEKNSRDKICLNFYISEEDMDMEKFMLNNHVLNKEAKLPIGSLASDLILKKNIDIYFIYWLANLVAIYDRGGTYKKFIQANPWLKNYLPNYQPSEMVGRRFVKARKNIFFNFLFNFIFGSCENIIKKIQLKKLPANLKEIMNKDTRVIINDKVLKLHVKDRREEYRKKWEEKIRELNI